MKKTDDRRRSRLVNILASVLLLNAFILPSAVLAQQTDDTSEDKDGGGKVVKLSPFEISEDANVGYAASETSSGSKIVVKLAELPQIINVITPELLADIGSDQPIEAMLKAATATSDFAGSSGINIMIRGFRAGNWALDGATTRYRSVINNYLIDNIEVIKGPSTLLFGPFGSYGGYVNANMKYAKKNMKNQVMGAIGTDSYFAGMADVGAKVGDSSYYRMVLAYHTEDRPGVDYDYTKYLVFGPSFMYEFSEDTRIRVRFEYIDSEQKAGRAAYDQNGVLLESFSTSGPLELTKHFNKSYGLQGILESALSDEWSMRASLALQSLKDDPLVTGVLTGNSYAQFYNFQPTPITTTQWSAYADLSLAWKKDGFGPGGHMSNDLVLGAEINYWNLENILYDIVRYPESRVSPLDPSNPDWSNYDYDPQFPTRIFPQNIEWLGGGFLQETLGFFDRKFLLTGGVKWNYDGRANEQQQLDVVSPSGVMQTYALTPYSIESTPTYRYGVVFKPIPTVSMFAGHTESYTSGAGTLRKVGGIPLDPQEGQNDEIGLKLDFPGIWGGFLSGSISHFNTEVTNIWRGDPNNAGFVVQDGVQENTGWEGQITYGGPKFSWLVGYYKGDGPITTSAPGQPHAPYAPSETFNFWGKYRVTEHFEIGGGYRWQSETESNLQNGDQTPAFGTADLFATYTMEMGKGSIRYRLGVSNLTDERGPYRINRPSDVFVVDGMRVKLTATYTW